MQEPLGAEGPPWSVGRTEPGEVEGSSHGRKQGASCRVDAHRCGRIPDGGAVEGALVGPAGPPALGDGALAGGVPGDVVVRWLDRLRLGRVKACGGVVLVPLLAPSPPSRPVLVPSMTGVCRGGVGEGEVSDYRSMPEAMARGELIVMEVSPEGVVGEVLVINRGAVPVMVLEGEEWSGGRQNRVPTRSVLVRPGIGVRVPVVCSEPGRWSYPGRGAGPAMGDSGACLPLGLRALMRGAGVGAQEVVRRGLMEWRSRVGMGGTMAEWQGWEVRCWEGLEEAFGWMPGQVGWMTCVHGAWQSVEVVSRPAAWRHWHGKWLRAVLAGAAPQGGHDGRDMPGTDGGWHEAARGILGDVTRGEWSRRPGVDLGEIHERDTPAWTGTTLMFHGEVLHGAWQRVGLGREETARRVGSRQRGQGMGMTSAPR